MLQIQTAISNLRNSPILTELLLLIGGILAILLIGQEAGDLAISTLTALAVYSILVDKKEIASLQQPHVALAIIVAIAGIVATYWVWQHASNISFSWVLNDLSGKGLAMRCTPFFLLLSYWVYREGSSGIRNHWKELILLAVLAIPDRIIMAPLVKPLLIWGNMPTLSHLTANLATGVTWILGLPVELDGIHIHAPNVIARVFEGCDGGRILDFMIRLTLMLILTFPVKPWKWPLILFGSMIIGFLINVFRVSVMVFIANTGDMEAFQYWHIGDGSKIFNLMAIIVFCFIGYFQITPGSSKK